MTDGVPQAAPVLSTPDTHAFEDPTPPVAQRPGGRLSNEQLKVTYETDRTIREILQGGWKDVALQFPDDMLVDAPRVFEILRDGLLKSNPVISKEVDSVTSDRSLQTGLETDFTRVEMTDVPRDDTSRQHKLTILGDTSYGACCVDEVAAEHVNAQVVVHYGRTCLSPTARLPIIYVFTTRPLARDSVIATFCKTITDKDAKVILIADLPYHAHVEALSSRLRDVGYSNLFVPSVIRNPSSHIPNRSIPPEANDDPSKLQEYSIFHVSDPPTSLLLNIASRVSAIYICPTTDERSDPAEAITASTAQMLRRRYALVTRLSAVPIFGILINTLSVKNYMQVLGHVKETIAKAGKKYYTFVVGKVNAAKVANFSEVGGWVVIGCWESSLIESKDFWKPIITPYELELALTDEKDRLWTGEWNSNIQMLLDRDEVRGGTRDDARSTEETGTLEDGDHADQNGDYDDDDEESEPPVFDLRTGKYVSQTRPMKRAAAKPQTKAPSTNLVKRANGDLATIGGEVSPAAEFLRSKRTWQGLGSDHEIAYQYDDDGNIQGAPMEQGRSGVARGYAVGEEARKT